MKLYGTPPSHFTRKARVLLLELGNHFQFIAPATLMETGVEKFAGNPLHQVPVLEDNGRMIIESDLICEYLLKTYGSNRQDLALYPQADEIGQKMRLAIMNGAMASGVKLIRAKRSGISWDYPFFLQEQASIAASLDWLDQDLGGKTSYEEGKLTLLDIALMSLAQWAIFREMIPSLEAYPAIQRFVEANRDRPSFAQTHPAREVK
jgi:glutathione S-transferase